MEQNKEIWKTIEGYEGLYEISSWGRVKSCERYVKGRYDDTLRIQKERMLKGSKDEDGYITVNLCKNGKGKNFRVHRLVAQAFIDNPNDYPIVNHKDEDPSNNRVENLEWCTYEYNLAYGTAPERHTKAVSKPILQYDLEGNFLKEWQSVQEISRETGFSKKVIHECCKGRQHTSHGYVWKFKHPERYKPNNTNPLNSQRTRSVGAYDDNGEMVYEFDSIREAEKTLNIAHGAIVNNIKGRQHNAGGYVWKYLGDIKKGVTKQVLQFTTKGEVVQIWSSAGEVQRQLGWSNGAISRSCHNGTSTYKGYLWRYIED